MDRHSAQNENWVGAPVRAVLAPAPLDGLPGRYAVLEDKYAGRNVLDGSVERLSEKGAEI
jgi:hypothetical protein